MKRIIYIVIGLNFLFSFNIYKEIKIEKEEIENLGFLQLIGIDIDHIFQNELIYLYNNPLTCLIKESLRLIELTLTYYQSADH